MRGVPPTRDSCGVIRASQLPSFPRSQSQQLAKANTRKKNIRLFWPIIVLLLIVIAAIVLMRDVGGGSSEVETQDVREPSPEWTTASESGVELDLPEAPLRRVDPEETVPEEQPQAEPE